MIRCHKCGYSNQYNAKNCIKCRTTLIIGDAVAPDAADKDKDYPATGLDHSSKKTVIIAANEETPWDQANVLPAHRNGANAGAQTVRRIIPDHRSCCLVALSVDEEKELRKIDIQGDSVSLDRALLDPGNASISRSGHANIYQKDGNWYIENTTAMKTTFIQVHQPMKLSDGDVVLLGDSLFKFKMG